MSTGANYKLAVKFSINPCMLPSLSQRKHLRSVRGIGRFAFLSVRVQQKWVALYQHYILGFNAVIFLYVICTIPHKVNILQKSACSQIWRKCRMNCMPWMVADNNGIVHYAWQIVLCGVRWCPYWNGFYLARGIRVMRLTIVFLILGCAKQPHLPNSFVSKSSQWGVTIVITAETITISCLSFSLFLLTGYNLWDKSTHIMHTAHNGT